MRVALTDCTTIAECFRDVEGQDVLLFIDNILFYSNGFWGFCPSWCMPSAVGYNLHLLLKWVSAEQCHIQLKRFCYFNPSHLRSADDLLTLATALLILDSNSQPWTWVAQMEYLPSRYYWHQAHVPFHTNCWWRTLCYCGFKEVQRVLQRASSARYYPLSLVWMNCQTKKNIGFERVVVSNSSCPQNFNVAVSLQGQPKGSYVPVAETVRSFKEILGNMIIFQKMPSVA